MDLDRFLNLLATVLGAIGSIYVLRSLLALTPDVTAAIARTHGDYSAPQLDSISAQRAESIVGAAVIILALALAVGSNAFVSPGLAAFPSRAAGLGAMLGGSVIVLLLALLASGRLKRTHRRDAARAITGHCLDQLLARPSLSVHAIDGLRSYAQSLLGLKFPQDTDPKKVLCDVAAVLGRKVPGSLTLPPDATNASGGAA